MLTSLAKPSQPQYSQESRCQAFPLECKFTIMPLTTNKTKIPNLKLQSNQTMESSSNGNIQSWLSHIHSKGGMINKHFQLMQ